MNTAKTIITAFFLVMAQFVSAQKEPIPYEWFENQSKIISNIQAQVTKLTFEGAKVVFPENNFTVSYSDKLASFYVRMNKDNQESTLLIEDIDFTKATGIVEKDDVVYVYFPKNSLTLQKYGETNSTEKRSYIDFFKEKKYSSMRGTLYHIISTLKVENGLMTREEATKHLKESIELNPYDFYKKYPQSVLAYEGKLLEEDYDRQVRFVKSFLNRYNMPVFDETTVSQYSKINPEIINLVKKYKKRTTWNIFIPLDSKDWLEKKDTKNFLSSIRTINLSGYCSSYAEDYNKIIRMGYTVLLTNSYNEAQQEYNRIILELKDNIDLQFFPSDKQKENETGVILSEKGKIGKDLMVNKAYRITIKINTHKIKKELWYQLQITAANTQEDHSCAR